MRAGNVDRHIALRRIERVEQEPHLGERTGAELDDLGLGADLGRDLAGALGEDAKLGARRVVLGQLADAVEQRRARDVVEELRRNAARRSAEAREQLAAEIGERRGPLRGAECMEVECRIAHQRSFASRSPENCQRAAGGKKLR
jgi:hypothetical protein